MKRNSRGFIALMSAIIISAVLLHVAITASLNGFMHREGVLGVELKARSSEAANACASKAFLLTTNDSAYGGLSLLHLNSTDECRVAVNGSYPKSIRVQATSSNASVTNLQINYVATTSQILFWQEVPVY